MLGVIGFIVFLPVICLIAIAVAGFSIWLFFWVIAKLLGIKV